MLNPTSFINYTNAFITIRYFLSLDVNKIDEKILKIGISNIVDLAHIKWLCYFYENSNSLYLENSAELVKHAINLTQLLNQDAKNDLAKYLAVLHNY